jgi:NADH-quinone oxidoreductase subunit L
MDFVIAHSWLIPLLPLIGAAIAGFLGAKWLKGQSHWPIWIGVGISAILSLTLLVTMLARAHGLDDSDQASAQVNRPVEWFKWIDVGNPNAVYKAAPPATTNPTDVPATNPADAAVPVPPAAAGTWYDRYSNEPLGTAPVHFSVPAGAWFDPLTAVMLSVVCGIGFVITVFAAGYMKGEAGYFRFFAYLGLFIFMMTCLVMGNNLIMLYLGWEGVGLSSYLLIGYYYEKPAAREAAKKAFLVNRVGDFGFGLGIMLSFLAFGTVSYFGEGVGTHTGLLELVAAGRLAPGTLTAFQVHALQWLPFLFMLGAFGKSAQFPLYVWLPDAMEGPTPVSALIHAATMVTAGVYMIARCGTLFVGNAAALTTIAAIGAFTALFAATIALRQFDLKKVFAYSTISQLGYMFVGVGVLAPVGAVFHLVTHAFFKALLFLSSGVVMHAMGGVLDMRQMSGIKRMLPKTRWLMLIGCLALSGAPPLAGFFSKDAIIGASFGHPYGNIIGGVLLVAAFLTAFYTFRLYFRVFEGPYVIPAPTDDAHGHAPDDAAHPAGPGAASHSAIETGTASHSGVDTHLDSPAHHAATDHGHGDHAHNHEPSLMIVPLIVLAVGALIAGFINYPFGNLGDFLGKSASFSLARDVAVSVFGDKARDGFAGEQTWFDPMMLVGAAIAGLGIACAWFLHLRNRALDDRLAAGLQPLPRILEAKYWVDQIYQALIVEPLRGLGNFCFSIDRYVIDILIAVVSWIPQAFGWIMKFTVQRGSLQGYASAMLFGIVIILLLVFMK